MFLSRIELKIRSYATHTLLASPQRIHAVVEGCFIRPEGVAKPRTLWRIDTLCERTYLIILSTERPDFTNVLRQYCEEGITGETKDYTSVLNSIKTGMQYSYRFVGNPVKKSAKSIVALVTAEQQLSWLLGKADKSGFKINETSVSIGQSDWQQFYRKKTERPVELNKIVYEGVLEVTDVEAFIGALINGIGRGKAYGCGLVTVIPRSFV